MLKLYIRDNVSGSVHEYGTDHHDMLIVQPDGSLQYLNGQCLCSTQRYTEEEEPEYSFCFEDGSLPDKSDEDPLLDYVLDEGGEYYNDPRVKEAQKEWKRTLAKVLSEKEGREVNPDDLTIIS